MKDFIYERKKMNRYLFLILEIFFVIFRFLIFKLHENKNINISMLQNSLIQRFEFYLRIFRFYI